MITIFSFSRNASVSLPVGNLFLEKLDLGFSASVPWGVEGGEKMCKARSACAQSVHASDTKYP